MTDSVQTAFQQLISLAAADPENFIFKTFISDAANVAIEGILAYLERGAGDGLERLSPYDPLRNIISSDSELADFTFFLSQLKRKSALEVIVENEIFGKNPRKQFQDLMMYLFTCELDHCLSRFLDFIEKFFQNQPFIQDIQWRYHNDEDLLMMKVRQTIQNLTIEEFFRIRKFFQDNRMKLTFEQFYENLPEVSEKLRVSEKLGK